MNTAAIRQQLHNYLEVADDKKVKAIYVMVADEIRESNVEYTKEFKAELDRRVRYYLNGGLGQQHIYQTPTTPTHQYEVGIEGPIIPKHLYFYFNLHNTHRCQGTLNSR